MNLFWVCVTFTTPWVSVCFKLQTNSSKMPTTHKPGASSTTQSSMETLLERARLGEEGVSVMGSSSWTRGTEVNQRAEVTGEEHDTKASLPPQPLSPDNQGSTLVSQGNATTGHYGAHTDFAPSLVFEEGGNLTTKADHSYNITEKSSVYWTSPTGGNSTHHISYSTPDVSYTSRQVLQGTHPASALSTFADKMAAEAFTSHTQELPAESLVPPSTPGSDLGVYPLTRLCNVTDLFYFDLHNLSWELNCSVNYSALEADDMDLVYKHPVLGGLLAFFAVVTILGNLLVIAAVARERYLRTVTNYFIVSLAIADLIIGGVVMPFSIFLEITNNVWIFGSDWCDVWHSFDVLASTASILNLSVISLDRYWAITDPIAYPSKMSTGRSFVLMALIWICSAAISFPAILWWRSVVTEPLPPHVCAFTEDTGYLIFSSLISFYFPVSIILFAYYKIYRAATEQTRSLRTGCKVMSTDGLNGEVMTLRIHRGGGMRDQDEAIHYSRAANSDSDGESPSHVTLHHHITPHGDVRPSRMISRKWKHFAISKKLSKLAKEQKAAKTLGIVMGVFCMCWVPFFVANVLYGLCNLECVAHADIILPVFTWLGYINSGMNPVIYACSMRDFRRAFLKILCCFCPGYIRFRSRKRYMETNYSLSTSSFGGMGCTVDRCSNVRL